MREHILIISNGGDPDTDIVTKALLERGENVFRFDTDAFSKGEISITLRNRGPNVLVRDGTMLNIDDIKSVWYRRPEDIRSSVVDPRQKAFAEKELSQLMDQLYSFTTKAFWVSEHYAIRRAEKKYLQLQIGIS